MDRYAYQLAVGAGVAVVLIGAGIGVLYGLTRSLHDY